MFKAALFTVVIIFAIPNTAAGQEHYCTYFGGVNKSLPNEALNMFQLEKAGCSAGDTLHIIIYDKGGMSAGREVMYLANEITQLCDADKPTTIVGEVGSGSSESGGHHAVCTYNGSRRRPRTGKN